MKFCKKNDLSPGLSSISMKARSFILDLIREPLLHFALVGAAVFLLFPRDTAPLAARTETSHVIDVTTEVRDRLATQFAAAWNRPPSPSELNGLIETHVREEVLYREALALGLDRDDAVIRHRLRLKMEYIGEGFAAAMTPTEAELAAWYAENLASFAAPDLAGFSQIMLTDPADAERALAALAAGADPATIGRSTLLPARVGPSAAHAVDGAFGPGFFDAVTALPPGVWAGPVRSAYGTHIVRLESVTESEPPPLDDVREAVTAAWRRELVEILRETQYRALLERYEVRLPDGGDE